MVFFLTLFLAFSTFAFGAVEGWSTAVCEGLLFLGAGVMAFRHGRFLRWPEHLGGPFLAVSALALVAALQLVPLPTALWNAVGDERAALEKNAAAADALLRSDLYRTEPFTGRLLPPDPLPTSPTAPRAWICASFTPLLTLRALLALLAAAALLLLLEALAQGYRDRFRKLAFAAGALGMGVGLVALVQYRPGAVKVMGLRESTHAGASFGPFINENNGMGFVNLAFCGLYYLAGRRYLKSKRSRDRLGWAILAAGLLAFHCTILAIRTSGAGAWTLLLVPVVASLHAMRRHPRAAMALALVLAVCAGALVVSAVRSDFTDLHGRLPVWRDALRGSGHWLLGNGLGSFSERFRAVLGSQPVKTPALWNYPENEIVQLAFEGGFAGALVGLGLVAFVLALGWKAIMGSGALFALVPALWGEALHAMTDFHFHLWPIVTLYLLLIAIVTTGLARQRLGPGSSRPEHRSPKRLHTGPPMRMDR